MNNNQGTGSGPPAGGEATGAMHNPGIGVGTAATGNTAAGISSSPSSGSGGVARGAAMDSASERTTGSVSNSPAANKATSASGSASNSGNASSPGGAEPTAQAVLDYLKKMGMGSAHLELRTLLNKEKEENEQRAKKDDKQAGPASTEKSDSGTSSSDALKQQLEYDDAVARNQRAVLTKSTGGGFGYDRDAAAPVVQWGVPDNTAMMRQSAAKKQEGKAGETPDTPSTKADALAEAMGAEEAQSYLDAFTALQIWVLSLPHDEDPLGNQPGIQAKTHDPIAAAQDYIRRHQKDIDDEKNRPDNDDKKDAEENKDETKSSQSTKEISLSSLVQHMAVGTSGMRKRPTSSFQLPPSSKPELLAVTFALLVHTYCELLEVGMESTAHVLRDAFQPIYDPLYAKEFRDLFQCTTTEDMMKLNSHNSQHMEALANLKSILVKIHSLQLKKEEYTHHARMSNPDSATKNAANKRLQEFDQTINVLQKNYNELSQRASAAFGRMHDLPFLRRARAVRWQLTLSTSTYALLAGFLNNHTAMQPSLLAMSTLLQTKCELHVEQRDPLPFTPACVLDDEWHSSRKRRKSSLTESDMVNWAAPAASNKRLYQSTKEVLPFPKFHLEEEYENADDARRDKRVVEFNRAMLVNGFRRLEALERKRDYQVMAASYDSILTSSATTGAAATDPSNTATPGAASKDSADHTSQPNPTVANALEPSILLSTLCANSNSSPSSKHDVMTPTSSSSSKAAAVSAAGGSSAPVASGSPMVDASSIWDESGIGLCCAEICPPDGRQVAVGCDDSGIRIWNLMDGMGPDGRMGDPVQVLLGHKNGFPVFDVSWNRDGRSLLSAGGDGSIRLWDTMAQGPFGQVGKPTQSSITSSSSKKSSSGSGSNTGGGAGSSTGGTITNAAAKQRLEESTATLRKANANPDMTVPGLRPESNPSVSGAALAVYRGHAPSTPIWSVAFAPCGYYFASAGADATARLWTTDRPSPVRLFAGHTGDSVNSVVFHPNCNYILTGCEDKTARLWDIQTGRCVRLLNGCSSGINVVQVSPSGQYAAAADVSGIVHLWDLGMGKKLTEFRSKSSQGNSNARHSKSMVHSLSFSSCGTTLAAGGDDCCIRIWDVNKATSESLKPVIDTPHKVFSTRRTMIMDLHYTKRNLLLSVGKYVTSL